MHLPGVRDVHVRERDFFFSEQKVHGEEAARKATVSYRFSRGS